MPGLTAPSRRAIRLSHSWVVRITAAILVLSCVALAPHETAAGHNLASSSICPASEQDLQTAIANAGSGGTVSFTCGSATTISFTSPIAIGQSVTLDASGSPAPVTFDAGNATGFFTVSANSVSFTLIGLTLQNAASADGAIFASKVLDKLTITDDVFSGNSASGSTFGAGGAIGDINGSVAITGSSFSSNSNPDGTGGAMNVGSGTITNSIFWNNFASQGGAVEANCLSVTNSTFTSNHAGASGGGNAGAISTGPCNNGHWTITGSTFDSNFADGTDCTSCGAGGAVSWNAQSGSITNSTFQGNEANNGGAIFVFSGSLNLVSSTLWLNAFHDINPNSQQIYNSGTISIGQTIIATVGGDGANCSTPLIGTWNDNGYNLLFPDTPSSGTSICGFSVASADVFADPQLDPNGLSNNGGPTQTIALEAGSPAIDAIPTSSGDCQPTGQRGNVRPDGSETACDIGAFESGYRVSRPTATPASIGAPTPTPSPIAGRSSRLTPTPIVHGTATSTPTPVPDRTPRP